MFSQCYVLFEKMGYALLAGNFLCCTSESYGGLDDILYWDWSSYSKIHVDEIIPIWWPFAYQVMGLETALFRKIQKIYPLDKNKSPSIWIYSLVPWRSFSFNFLCSFDIQKLTAILIEYFIYVQYGILYPRTKPNVDQFVLDMKFALKSHLVTCFYKSIGLP